jgi:Ca2+-binding EF-hand superfamily protein
LFRKLDIDGNGKVDREELVQALANSELPWMTLQEVDELMAALDKNQDGVIDQGEFMTCLKL